MSKNGENGLTLEQVSKRITSHFVEDLKKNPVRIARLLAHAVSLITDELSKLKGTDKGETGGPFIVQAVRDMLDLDKMIELAPKLGGLPDEPVKEMLASCIAAALCIVVRDAL
jgi:hypothetical protein